MSLKTDCPPKCEVAELIFSVVKVGNLIMAIVDVLPMHEKV